MSDPYGTLVDQAATIIDNRSDTEWQRALRTVISEFAGQFPTFGAFDCMQFAARYVFELSGVDHSSKFDYHDKRGALAILSKHGGFVGLISNCLGAPADGPAMPGDLVVCEIGESDGDAMTTGIVSDGYVWGLHPDHGLGRFPPRIRARWHVCPQ